MLRSNLGHRVRCSGKKEKQLGVFFDKTEITIVVIIRENNMGI